MTSEGSPHARFRRALLTKNLTLIDAAARELRHLALDDALRMLVVMADRGDARFDRAGARFAARAIAEARLGLAEARYILALVEALPHSPDTIGELLRRTLTLLDHRSVTRSLVDHESTRSDAASNPVGGPGRGGARGRGREHLGPGVPVLRGPDLRREL